MKLQVCKKCNECGLSDRNSIICLFRQDFLRNFIRYQVSTTYSGWEWLKMKWSWRITGGIPIENTDGLAYCAFFLVERSLLWCWGITKFSRWGFHSALFTKTFSICCESIFMCATISRWVCQPIQSWCVGHFLKLT